VKRKVVNNRLLTANHPKLLFPNSQQPNRLCTRLEKSANHIRLVVSGFKGRRLLTANRLPIYIKGFDYCTTLIQQLHNNPSHEGGPQYVGPTLR